MNTTARLLETPTSVREKIAQLMFVRIGSNLPPVRTVEEDAERIGQLLSDCPLGGLILFNGRRDSTPETLKQLQSISHIPLLVSSDIERGVGQQLHGPELFPHAMAFEALGDEAESAVEEFAYLTAAEARLCGLHINFAPVADVNVDPRNPIIATRAFGSDPTRVAQLVSAFVKGSERGGLLSTAKHFPGHGNTHGDSHHELPAVTADHVSLESCELIPFQAAIHAGVPLIMSAHVRYPAWDDSGGPATLSKVILIDVLRNKLGFDGAVVSDSLLMEGVKSQCGSEGELAVRALDAGVDILLDVDQPMETLKVVEAAVHSGRLSEHRVDEALARVWKLKQQVFAAPPANLDATDGFAEQSEQLANRVARESLKVESQSQLSLPLDKSKPTVAVLVRPYHSHLDPPEQPLGEAIRSIVPQCQYHELDPTSEPDDYAQALAATANAEQLVVAIIVKPAAWHAFGLLDEQQSFVEMLLERQSCVLASLGTPEALGKFDLAATKICSFSDVPASQRALAEFLF